MVVDCCKHWLRCLLVDVFGYFDAWFVFTVFAIGFVGFLSLGFANFGGCCLCVSICDLFVFSVSGFVDTLR